MHVVVFNVNVSYVTALTWLCCVIISLKKEDYILNFSVCLSVRLSVCPTHGHHFSVHYSRSGTLLAGQYLYNVPCESGALNGMN